MSSDDIKQREIELGNKFLRQEIDDSFTFLGSHQSTNENIIIRAYLPAKGDWQVINKENEQPLDATLLHHEKCLHVWHYHGKSLKNYAFRVKKEKDTANSSLIVIDSYSFDKLLDDKTQYLWNKGQLYHAWKNLGANYTSVDGCSGYIFRVWAPNAKKVAVVGDFNDWNPLFHGMRLLIESGLWEIFIPGVKQNLCYKYHITTSAGVVKLKSDPYAKQMQHPPNNASVTYHNVDINWQDQDWLDNRQKKRTENKPISIYEVHIASWRKQGDRFMSYYELAKNLVPYVKDLAFTHVELMPISEYPLDASWGYQPIGFFAPSVRFGKPEELKYLIDKFHQAGIGVILDWVPAHFPSDDHGLAQFDGSYLYEYQDRRKGFNYDWKTLVYNFSRREVCNYLISNAIYWLKEYHLDGLRMDAISSILYLNYCKKEGEWEPNIHGGEENLEAIEFLKALNHTIHQECPGALSIAEEATTYNGVTKDTKKGGLGFDLKWNMGWMHDSLDYISREPHQKPDFHHVLTHCIDYAFHENHVLPLSHDEVVHGKSPMLGKMPGFDEHKFALLRAYYCYMWFHPGKKLLFMGNEFAQRKEWNFENELQWELVKYKSHYGMNALIRNLNLLYKGETSLYASDNKAKGFKWLKKDDANESVFAFCRTDQETDDMLVCVLNFSDKSYEDKNLGIPRAGDYQILLHSEAIEYGGCLKDWRILMSTNNDNCDGYDHSLSLSLPALSCILFKYMGSD
ncbi:MAG: 1,4-alpha-glucan branching protein GlgB [SAR324 cluster bacterium]|nr:1,4-alpha-glucan branching protein GlgB [SAR324 cluster bacterium]